MEVRGCRYSVLLLLTLAFVCVVESISDSEKVDKMLENYDRRQSPHGSDATVVKVGLYIESIANVNVQSMDFTVTMYVRMSWYDPRLKFTPANEEKKIIKLPDGYWESLWVPDLFFRNEKKSAFHTMTVPNRLMRLYSDGKIWYAMRISATFACAMMLHKYPFDRQRCPIMIESYGQTMDTMVLKFMDDRKPVGIEIGSDMIAQFTLNGVDLVDCSKNYTTGAYPCLMARFNLQRDSGYAIMQIYMPTILIVIVSWVSFWITVKASTARILVGLLSVLTMTGMSTSARSFLPHVSYVTALDVWLFACLLFVVASLVEYVLVSFLANSEQSTGGDEMEMGEVNNKQQQNAEVGFSSKKKIALRIDQLCRIVFPVAFFVFNLIYWIIYTV